jgi:flagellar hook-associated protein 3 FlgL
MLAGLEGFGTGFLADLSNIENRISSENKQITSGVRVGQASDDPTAISPILDYQLNIDQTGQVQANLNTANVDATAADGALQSASSLMDRLVSLATQGASSTTTASSRAVLGQEVQQIAQQMVTIANTTVQGRYIFGGDDATTAPYSFDWSQPDGVVPSASPASTASTLLLRNATGAAINVRMTAQGIFDLRDGSGNPTSGNVFQAIYALGQALQANDQAGVQNAIPMLNAAVNQIGQATTFYGHVESWIQTSLQDATQLSTNSQQALGTLRDTDIAAAASQLTLDQTALNAALAAHGSFNTRSLFSYLG